MSPSLCFFPSLSVSVLRYLLLYASPISRFAECSEASAKCDCCETRLSNDPPRSNKAGQRASVEMKLRVLRGSSARPGSPLIAAALRRNLCIMYGNDIMFHGGIVAGAASSSAAKIDPRLTTRSALSSRTSAMDKFFNNYILHTCGPPEIFSLFSKSASTNGN